MTGFLIPASGHLEEPVDDVSEPLPALTVLVPCFDEDRDTLSKLLEGLDIDAYHGSVYVDLVVEAGRPADISAARSAAAAHGGSARLVIVPSCQPKARAVNHALLGIRTPLVAIFDADVRIDTRSLAILARTLHTGDFDIVEGIDVCVSSNQRSAAANGEALAFHSSMQWLSARWGRRFMGSSAIVVRRDLFNVLGPYPEDGVEEGYRWSMNNPTAQVKHGLVALRITGDVPDSVTLMLRQRTRWITGQLAGSIAALAPSAAKDRRLAAIGAASIILQGLWSVSLLAVPFSRGARIFFTTLAVLEYRRLAVPAVYRVDTRLQVHADPFLALLLELGEGFVVWRAGFRLLTGGSGRWDHARENRKPVGATNRRTQWR